MRILFLALDTVLTDLKGDAVHVRELARSFAAEGHDVLLLAAADGLEAERLRTAVIPPGGNVRVARRALREAKPFRADVVYERRSSGKMGATLGAALGVPFFLEVNGLPELEAPLQGRRGPREGAVRTRIRRTLLRSARGVVAVSPALKATLVDWYGLEDARVTVVPNGANVDVFRPLDRPTCRTSLGLDKRTPLVGFVGNFAPWQGIEVLLDALPLLKHEDARAHLVGGGPLWASLRDEAGRRPAGGRAVFVGPVPNDHVPVHIGACDVCVAPFPSTERNKASGLSPIKVFEYMACGRPCVTTDIVDGAEDLAATGAVALVPPGDTEELAETIDDLLDDAPRRERMGRAGRAIAVERFSWQVTARCVAAFLEAQRVAR